MNLAVSVKLFFLLIGDYEEQEYSVMEDIGVEDNTTNSSVFAILEVSMHALASHIIPRTIRLKVKLAITMSISI